MIWKTIKTSPHRSVRLADNPAPLQSGLASAERREDAFSARTDRIAPAACCATFDSAPAISIYQPAPLHRDAVTSAVPG